MSSVQHRDRRRRTRNGPTLPDPHLSSISTIYDVQPEQPQEYRFFCQLAHGSPTGIISGFKTVRELHAKIAECFDLNVTDIMYCTLNTHKLDVDRVLGREIGLNDFLFAHVKSQPKEIRIRKESDAFGMTLTDTGCGVVFIKRLFPGGMMAYASHCCGGMIEIGDQIEKVDNISFIGRRHFEVAAYLKSIPIGATFLLRLISPEKSPIYSLNCRGTSNASAMGFCGKKRTIRLRSNGTVEERLIPDTETEKILAINRVLGNALGFEDDELARLIYKYANRAPSAYELTLVLNARLFEFYIPPEVIHQAWDIVNRSNSYEVMDYYRPAPMYTKRRGW